MSDAEITFENIESPSLRLQLKEMIEDITQLSPSDAAVRATFHFIHNRFLAEVRIASESVYMQVGESASAIGELLSGVKGKLMSQIVDWRSQRFAV